MKKLEQMTRAELIQCVKALEKGAPAVDIAFEHERLLHELQVQQIELETQNRELREAQLLLESSRDRYADLYDFAPVGYLTLDDKGIIREINLTAVGLLGAERTRLVGMPFHLQVAREDLNRFREYLRGLSDERSTIELRLLHKGGNQVIVLLQSVLFYDEEKTGFLCRMALSDLTALKQAERVAQQSAELNRGILQSLTAHIAVLDEEGNIIAVNDAWDRFARANGDAALAHSGPGTNYLKICQEGIEASDGDAKNALGGIEAVLKRALPSFTMEYPCHSPGEQRWFFMSVTPLNAELGGVVISHVDVSERRLAEQAVFDNEARLRAILDTAVEGIITIDERGIIESMNPAAVEMFGYAAEKAVGQNVKLLMPSPDREQHDGYLSHYRATGERKIIGHGREVEGRRKDGRVFPLELSVSEVHLTGRRIFTGFARDITRRRTAEDLLRASEERFRTLSEASPLGICMTDAAGKCTYTNPRWQQMSGLSDEENLGDGWTKVIHPDDRQALADAWARTLQTGQEFLFEFRLLRSDKTIRWVRARSRAILNQAGQVIGYVGVDEDITARKREDQRRRLQYDLSHLLAASAPLQETIPQLLEAVAVSFDWHVGEFWEVVENSEALRVLHVWHAPGRKLAAFVKHSLTLSLSMFDGLPSQVRSTRQPEWIPDIARCPHVHRRRAAARAGLRSALAFPILVNGELLGIMAFLTHGSTEPDSDLLEMFTSLGSQIGQYLERKKAEQALREANEFSKQVIGGAEAGIVVYDREGRFLVWNPFMEQLTGFRAEELLGRQTLEVFPFLREQQFETFFRRALAGEIFETEDTPFDVPEKGKRGWKAERFSPLRNAQKEIIGVIVAVRDLTERRRLESELLEITDREQQRIGHDLHDGLGQQLTALEMKNFILQEDLAANNLLARRARLQEHAQQIGEALRACVTVTRSLARGLAPVDIKADGLTAALQQLAHTIAVPGRVDCRFVCPTSVTLENAPTAGHLYRIAQEAVNNALKHARTRRIEIKLEREPGALCLQVKDVGRGMPPKRKSISGMGLEVMRHRAHVIGASLEINSQPGQGVTVTCRLPLKEQKP